MKILQIDSSVLGEASASRQITNVLVERLRRDHPGAEVVVRDLGVEPIPHLTALDLAAGRLAPDQLDDETRALAQLNNAVLEEFLAADVIVVGAPMYNFGVPSTLKAWIDRIAIAGKTFRYTEHGPEGLAGGKRVIIASARGGLYSGGQPSAPFDFQETYLRGVFGFLGVTDVQVVRAEGLNLGPEQRQAALDAVLGASNPLAA
jgi:FMN-dependent NADH-azoreductase